VRRWRAGDGTERHHLIDPQTGAPVEGPWRTATVVADTCVAANAAATEAIVLGVRGAARLAARGLAARLVDADGIISRIGGWPEPVAAVDGRA
jgi:thiamine biosynthesis lipoprotein